jgi:Tol biopolymer transport system component
VRKAQVVALCLPCVVLAAGCGGSGGAGKIAFVYETDKPEESGIFTMHIDGSGRKKLIASSRKIEVKDPLWSPDRRRIAFMRLIVAGWDGGRPTPSIGVERGAIWVARDDGSDLRPMTAPPSRAFDELSRWSPDGQRMLFGRERLSRVRLMIANEETGARAVRLRFAFGGSWSPRGTKLAAVGGRTGLHDLGVWILDNEGRSARKVTGPALIYSPPAWAREGSEVAYTGGLGAVRVVDTLTGRTRRLTAPRSGLYDYSPTWSPDGKKIAFVRGGELEEYTGTHHVLYVVDSDGRNLRRLRDLGIGHTTTIAWSPASDRIAFSVLSGNQFRLHVIDAGGAHDRDLGVGYEPAWQPSP